LNLAFCLGVAINLGAWYILWPERAKELSYGETIRDIGTLFTLTAIQ